GGGEGEREGGGRARGAEDGAALHSDFDRDVLALDDAFARRAHERGLVAQRERVGLARGLHHQGRSTFANIDDRTVELLAGRSFRRRGRRRRIGAGTQSAEEITDAV